MKIIKVGPSFVGSGFFILNGHTSLSGPADYYYARWSESIMSTSKKARLISAIHYNNHRIYIRRILTHAEYDRGDWKE